MHDSDDSDDPDLIVVRSSKDDREKPAAAAQSSRPEIVNNFRRHKVDLPTKLPIGNVRTQFEALFDDEASTKSSMEDRIHQTSDTTDSTADTQTSIDTMRSTGKLPAPFLLQQRRATEALRKPPTHVNQNLGNTFIPDRAPDGSDDDADVFHDAAEEIIDGNGWKTHFRALS